MQSAFVGIKARASVFAPLWQFTQVSPMESP